MSARCARPWWCPPCGVHHACALDAQHKGDCRNKRVRELDVCQWNGTTALRFPDPDKTLGLIRVKDVVHSSDSMAWSYHARKNPKHPECIHPGKCGNCLRFALRWRARLLRKLCIHPLEDLVGRHVA